jgi:hypothetical protein
MYDKIYIYVYDVSKNNKKLVHIFDVHKNVKMLEKYVQISHSLKLLSIPDEEFLHIFSVDELVRHNSLKIYDRGISLDLTHNIPTVYKKLAREKNTTVNMSKQTDIDSVQYPHKCILYNDKYVIICKTDNKISGVIIYNFEKQDTKILDIDNDNEVSHIFFSENGKYLMKYVNDKLYIVNIDTEKTRLIILAKQLCDTIYQNTFSISDDGELIGPGIAITGRINSAASRAVRRDPLRNAASTTSVASDNAAISRLRVRNRCGRADTPGITSETIAPFSHISSKSRALPDG